MQNTNGIDLKYICNSQTPQICPTLDELVDSSTVAEVVNAIDLANKENGVFTGISPLVLEATVEDSLSLAQRNILSRVSLYKIGTPVIYDANDIGSNNPGRGTDFFTLPYNNPNGNTNRFELLGTDVVIDWAYGLYWTKLIQSPARTTWALHNSNSAVLTLEGLTGWRLPSATEVNTILQSFSGDPLDYSPFNINFATTTGANFGFATGQNSLFNTSNCVIYFLISASRGINWNYVSNNKSVNTTVALYCKSF
jgi:hypothetical protein